MVKTKKVTTRGRWLILSHAFNMDGRAASQTITDKIPHLRRLGVEPIVISAVTGSRDAELEHHQLLPVSPVALRFDLRHVLRRHLNSKPAYKLAVATMTLLLLPLYLLEKLFIRLEPQWSWALPAYRRGARILREGRCSVIYSTGGANSAHWAGYLLARRFGLPWVAEVHDPMVYEPWEKSRMAYRFAYWLEGRICRRADVAIWFTETARDRARNRHPELGERGKMMIPGADAPVFARQPWRKGAHFVVAHFGSLAPSRNLAIFIDGLKQLLARKPELAKVIRLHLYGGGVDAISQAAIAALPDPSMVESFGRLERDPATGESGRDRVLKRMNAADCLLLLHGIEVHCEEYIPSKLYEYLWTQRPVLGLVWRNAQMERILRDNGHFAVRADDAAGVSAALDTLVERWRNDELADSAQPSPYSVAAATARLVEWVDEAQRRRSGETART
jgi:glycosyltransferase involved in cell wall biosynthesis